MSRPTSNFIPRIQGLSPRVAFVAAALATPALLGATPDREAYYQDEIMPIMDAFCYDCHDYESKKGDFSLDDFETFDLVSQNKEHWFNVFKNLQAQVMPPPEEEPLPASERSKMLSWIQRDVFEVDPNNPDPGKVIPRRLNRVEYENTIRDLTGVKIDANEVLPADNTGYGFDNIADTLTLSPLHLEKYIKIANEVIAKAIPEEPYQWPIRKVDGSRLLDENGKQASATLPFNAAHTRKQSFTLDHDGGYQLQISLSTSRFFDFDYGEARFDFYIDDKLQKSLDLKHVYESEIVATFTLDLAQGPHQARIELTPTYDREKIDSAMRVTLNTLSIEGPMDPKRRSLKADYQRFFPDGPPPQAKAEQEAYGRKVLEKFAYKAYRRPPSEAAIDRLAAFAQAAIDSEGLDFEAGMARAFTAILASPSFLYRIEEPLPLRDDEYYPLLDEYSLASRLSYFLWSTMPDDTLLELASKGQLRAQLRPQLRRMLADPKAQELTENFVGQWLKSRDITLISLNERAILAGEGRPDGSFRLGGNVRKAMRMETEMSFEHVLKNNRSLLELINPNYTFLNADLATFYGIPGVRHREMRKVELPPDSHRGGILAQGAILGVTSNPTRTSPVKRGLFILENLLGTPSPPAPADVPQLEAAQEKFAGDHIPNMRELLEMHREEPLCRSCHERMDPLGLALENFNAMGMWRDREAGVAIDTSGTLLTGESFNDIRDLKRILANERRLDYYRAVSEKLMIYALGRGIDYYDTGTIDQLVHTLENNEGRVMTLIEGIIDSPAFQKTRPRIPAPAFARNP